MPHALHLAGIARPRLGNLQVATSSRLRTARLGHSAVQRDRQPTHRSMAKAQSEAQTLKRSTSSILLSHILNPLDPHCAVAHRAFTVNRAYSTCLHGLDIGFSFTILTYKAYMKHRIATQVPFRDTPTQRCVIASSNVYLPKEDAGIDFEDSESLAKSMTPIQKPT